MKENAAIQLRQRIATLEREITLLKQRGDPYRGIRKRSGKRI
ncbi:MAG TPA: hypothetical protein PLD30_14365 [Candidatus Competibacteraceae bacterium]|nr:hypothetical protein [Candidatus Competibacteraceae bacterium]